MNEQENNQGLLAGAGWQAAPAAQNSAKAVQAAVAAEAEADAGADAGAGAGADAGTAAGAAAAGTVETKRPVACDLDAPLQTGSSVTVLSSPESTSLPPQLSAVTLMLLGFFGGVYLLYTWAWLMIGNQYALLHRLSQAQGGSLWLFLQTVIFWAATLAPAAWFTAAFIYAKRKPVQLTIALFIGLCALAPLPLFLTAGA